MSLKIKNEDLQNIGTSEYYQELLKDDNFRNHLKLDSRITLDQFIDRINCSNTFRMDVITWCATKVLMSHRKNIKQRQSKSFLSKIWGKA